MALPPPSPSRPETIRRGGFQYDGTFTTIDGVAFEKPQYLLRLCYPGDPERWKIKAGRGRPPKMEKITDLEAAHTLTRKFVLAQFRFYGLPPPYQSSADEVVGLFRENVAAGHFRQMAPDVAALRDSMAREWEARRDALLAAADPEGHGGGGGGGGGGPMARPRGRPKGSVRKVDPDHPLPPATVVGAYVVSSKELHERWFVNGSLTLDVAPTATAGVYRGTFNFGVVFGVLFLSADEKLLATHVRRVDAGDDPDTRKGSDGGGGAGGAEGAGSKRKLPPSGPSGGEQQQPQQLQHHHQHPQHQPHQPQHAQHPQHPQHQQYLMPAEKKLRLGDGLSELPAMHGLPDMRGMGPGPSTLRGLGGLGPLMGGGPPPGSEMTYGGTPGGQPTSSPGYDGAGRPNSHVGYEASTAADTRPVDAGAGSSLTPNTHPTPATTGALPPAPGFTGGGRPPHKIDVRWRGRGRADKHVQTGEHRGTLKFTNKHYTKFAGEMDLAFLGADEITGKRVSNVPTLSGEVWSDYLETVYDWTRGQAAGGWN